MSLKLLATGFHRFQTMRPYAVMVSFDCPFSVYLLKGHWFYVVLQFTSIVSADRSVGNGNMFGFASKKMKVTFKIFIVLNRYFNSLSN